MSQSPGPPRFDVFISYNGDDRDLVEPIAERLRSAGLSVWFDRWSLTAGGAYQNELFAGLHSSAACAYFVGPHGEGDWSRMELDVARSRAAKERAFRLFPVLLPGLPEPFDRTTLPPFLSQRTWVDYRAGVHDGQARQTLINAVKGVPTGSSEVAPDAGEPPYRGLLPFGQAHSEFFFGREADTQRLVEKLRGSRFLAVLGPSGSGKSSLVLAGLLPALQRGALSNSEQWPIRVLRPGGSPLSALAAVVAQDTDRSPSVVLDELQSDERTLHLASETVLVGESPEMRTVMVIDQSEELFTLGRDADEQSAFVANIAYAAAIPGGRTSVVMTMRADFYARLAAHPELATLVADAQYLVSPLDADGLRAAIEEPAHRVGLTFEEGLVDTILEDVADRPGVLPLLEHALLELWTRRRGSMLTLEGYRESGGVLAALAMRAESTFASFSTDEQDIVRRALLRLTETGDGTEDARRRATLSELVGSRLEASAVESVVNRLADSRLVTVSRDPNAPDVWVDLSHEALIKGWPRMRGWIDESREQLRIRRRIADGAADWERLQREDDALLRGARLAEANEFAQSHAGMLSEAEQSYVRLSQDRAARFARSVERRRRLQLVGAAALAVFFLALSGVSGALWISAEQARQEALSRQLAAQSLSEEASALKILLALESVRTAHGTAAEQQANQALLKALRPESRTVNEWRTPLPAESAALSPDGSVALAMSADGSVQGWRLDPGGVQPLDLSQAPRGFGRIVASTENSQFAYATEQGVAVVDVQPSGVEVRAAAGDSISNLGWVGADSYVSWTAGPTLERFVWSGSAMDAPRPGPVHGADGFDQVLSPDAHYAFIPSGPAGVSVLKDLRSGQEQPLSEEIESPLVAFSAAGSVVAVAGRDDSAAYVFYSDVAPEPIEVEADISAIAVSADGTQLAIATADKHVRLFATGPPHARVRALPVAHEVSTIAWSGDGKRLIVGDVSGNLSVFEEALKVHPLAATATVLGPTTGKWDPSKVSLGGGGVLLVSPDGSGEYATVRSLDSGRVSQHVNQRAARSILSNSGESVLLAEGGTVKEWSSIGIRTVADIGAEVVALASADGGTVAIAGRDGTSVHPGNGTPVAIPVSGSVLALSADGRLLAVSVAGAEVQGAHQLQVYDVQTQALLSPPAITSEPAAMAFAPDGSWLFAAVRSGSGGTLIAYDATSLREMWRVTRPIPVVGIAFAEDGAAVTFDQFGLVERWQLDPIAWPDIACGLAGRSLSETEWSTFLAARPYQETCPTAVEPEPTPSPVIAPDSPTPWPTNTVLGVPTPTPVPTPTIPVGTVDPSSSVPIGPSPTTPSPSPLVTPPPTLRPTTSSRPAPTTPPGPTRPPTPPPTRPPTPPPTRPPTPPPTAKPTPAPTPAPTPNTTPASLSSPSTGSPLPGATVTFRWNTLGAARYYSVWVGSQPPPDSNDAFAYHDIAADSGIPPGRNSTTLSGLPTDGSTVYVRLFTKFNPENGPLKWRDYVFQTASSIGSSALDTWH